MYKIYSTERLILRVLDGSFSETVLSYYLRNREFLQEWEFAQDEEFYTEKIQKNQLANDLKSIENGSLLKLWIFNKDDCNNTIGSISFSNIIRGSFLSSFLGYKLDKDEINKGYITEALEKGIEIVFNDYKLHRIEANIMPKNKPSLRVVEKLGFYNEGLALKYLKINGRWEDHIHMVLISQDAVHLQ